MNTNTAADAHNQLVGPFKPDQGVRPAGRSKLGALSAIGLAVVLAGCSVTPQPLTKEEVSTRAVADKGRMYKDQNPISGPVTLEEALARALKYNLDYRLKRMESALALGLADQVSMDMLPQLVASAGYRDRSNDSGGYSVGILDGERSDRPTTSSDRNVRTKGLELSWNVLDFGVSYYRAQQQGDQFLVAEERRRKVVQNLLQDVRAAYWRALAAQRLLAQTDEVLARANTALMRSREAENQKLISPALALAYQRALLDATTLLNQRRQDMDIAKKELAALMNVEPGVAFTLSDVKEEVLPRAPNDSAVLKLEEMALIQRPELREEDLRKRITAAEARKQMLSLFPNLSFGLGRQGDSNRLNYNSAWTENSMSIAWNVMRLASIPAMKNAQAYQEKTDEARRLALSMAVITQTRIGADRYKLALEDFRLAEQAAQVDARLANYTKASVTSRAESELELIRTQARAVLGEYQRSIAYANAQIAFGRLYNALGFDPIADDFDGDDLNQLKARIAQHLSATQTSAFELSSNLFGPAPKLNVRVAGVKDSVLRVRLVSAAKELLQRHEIQTEDTGGDALLIQFREYSGPNLDKARWTVRLVSPQGETALRNQFEVTTPKNADAATIERSFVAALSSNLKDIKRWAGS